MKIKNIMNNKSVDAIRNYSENDKSKYFPEGRQIRILGFMTREQFIRLCTIYPYSYSVWINGQCKSEEKKLGVGAAADLNEAKQIIELVSQQRTGEFIYIDPEIHGGWGISRLKSSYNGRQKKKTHTKLAFALAEIEAGQEIIYE